MLNMKHYRIRRNLSQETEEIEYDNLYISPDLDYISGTTSPYYNFSEKDEVYVSTPYTQGSRAKLKLTSKNVLEQGYCDYQYPYEIHYDNDIEYIIYNDGKAYYNKDGLFSVQGKNYTKDGNIVKVPTRYYVLDSTVEIGGYTYDIDLDEISTTYNMLLTLNNGDIVTIIFYNENNEFKPILKTLFKIYRGDNQRLSIDNVSCCEDIPYVMYMNEKYYIDKVNNSYTVDIPNIEPISIEISENLSYAVINGTYVQVQFETVSVANSSSLLLTLSNPTMLNTEIPLTCQFVQSVNNQYLVHLNSDDQTELNKGYIIYNGCKYNIQENIVHKIQFSDGSSTKTYNVNYNEDGVYAYITVNGYDIYFTISDDGNKLIKDSVVTDESGETKYEEKEYEIHKSNGVVINDQIYEAIGAYDGESDEAKYYYVNIYEKPTYFLKISDFKNNYLVKCFVDIENYNLSDDEYESNLNDISSAISSNVNMCAYYATNAPFGYKFVIDKNKNDNTNISEYNNSTTDINKNNLHIFKIKNYLTIPLTILNEDSLNINQAQVVEDYFFNKEKEKAINPIVDMEKDLYYPYIKTGENKFTMVTEINFNLHFRTRDLESWKVIEDNNDGVSTDVSISQNCNWFITDYYKDIDGFSNKDKANASDLLGFLDFTNDDVFYQKSKIGKSFLRLTFYDSPDPKRQTLLHSATIFMNEGNLYNKFINNVKNGEFSTIILNDDSVSRSNVNGISTSISVDTELANGDEIKFDETKRLSSQFVIKNRYEEETSSEGFYVYMFKNLGTKLHEKNIYMKVDFNHAGVGRTIPFILPMEDDGITPLDLENDTSSENWEKLKKGVKLKDLYKNMFIELKAVFDLEHNCYIYYKPQVDSETNNKMVFNLFELKIANED